MRERGAIIPLKVGAIIGPPAKCHFNGVSLAGRWWPNFECWLGNFVNFRGSGSVLLRNPIFLWIFRRGPSGSANRNVYVFDLVGNLTFLTNVVINRSSLCQKPAEVFYEIWQNQLTGSWSTFPFQISDAWLYDNIYHILPIKHPCF